MELQPVSYDNSWTMYLLNFHIVALILSLGGEDFDCLILSSLEFRSGGATSTQVTVAIVDDNTVEMDEEFSVQISSTNPRVTVQQGTADVTIIDDDGNGEN